MPLLLISNAYFYLFFQNILKLPFHVYPHRAEGTNVILDPHTICNKTRRLRGRLAEICKDKVLMAEIINGIDLGFQECKFQFSNLRWNCTTLRRSIRKILMKGKYSLK